MDCWQYLEIEPTNDIRVIKKAYAKRLKLTKPDEKPEEFQELHNAYQYAQYLARNNERLAAQADVHVDIQDENQENLVSDEQLFAPLEENEQQSHEQSSAPQNAEELEEESGPQEYIYKAEMDEVHQKIVELLASPSLLGKRYNWEFLETHELILDFQFNQYLGLTIFSEISKLWSMKRPLSYNYSKMPKHILNYLDGIFSWDSNREMLYHYFGYELVENILRALVIDHHVGMEIESVKGGKRVETGFQEVSYASGGKRFSAFCIDAILLAAIMAAVKTLGLTYFPEFITWASEYGVKIFILMYVVLCLLLESSSLRATPGKLLMKISVTNKQHQRLSFWHNLLRVVVVGLCMGTVIVYLLLLYLDTSIWYDKWTSTRVIENPN